MFCPVCGVDNPPERNACVGCGAPLSDREAPVPPGPGDSGLLQGDPVGDQSRAARTDSPSPLASRLAVTPPPTREEGLTVVQTGTTFTARLKQTPTLPLIVGSGLFLLGIYFWFQGYFVAYNYLTGILLLDDTYPVRFFYLVLVFVLGYFLIVTSRRFVPASAVRGAVLLVLGLLAIVISFLSSVYLLVVEYEMVLYLYLLMLFSVYMAVLGMVSLGVSVCELTTASKARAGRTVGGV